MRERRRPSRLLPSLRELPKLRERREGKAGKLKAQDYGYYERMLTPERLRSCPELRPGWEWEEGEQEQSPQSSQSPESRG